MLPKAMSDGLDLLSLLRTEKYLPVINTSWIGFEILGACAPLEAKY